MLWASKVNALRLKSQCFGAENSAFEKSGREVEEKMFSSTAKNAYKRRCFRRFGGSGSENEFFLLVCELSFSLSFSILLRK
jgi:hypothetical protein